ncbi:MAG: ferrochelatase [Proteobacteria bacterium]|nr:MAG: ferrochelatase [Pseudomonadota bacterium]
MEYKNATPSGHSQSGKVGVLITNLGSPDAPAKKALIPYLKQFLWDPRVVELPRLIWWFVLNLVILRVRPSASAAAYKKVWTEQGAPLKKNTIEQARALGVALKKKWGDRVELDWAMRYGQPSIEHKVQEMMNKGVDKLVVLPLYPQYAAATTASTFDAIANDFCRRRWIPELRFVTSYHDNPLYIEALAKSVEQHWSEFGRAQKLVLSYHGIPVKYVQRGDPYQNQCYKTSSLLVERLGLKEDEYMITFQSRLGREEWLRPYIDETMRALPEKGVRSVQVMCPGFSADCLETVEEIAEENREYFLESGGERFEYISALNARSEHITALAALVEANMSGWLDANLTDQHCEN